MSTVQLISINLMFDPQEGELFCNVLRQQLDNSEEVDNLVQRQVLFFLCRTISKFCVIVHHVHVHLCLTVL